MSAEQSGALMVRIAKALVDEVAVGDVFVTAEFFGERFGNTVANCERRLRDLGELGWVIDSYKEDPLVPPGSRRLVQVGSHVWIAGVDRQLPRFTQRASAAHVVDWSQVSAEELRELIGWMDSGERPVREVDRAWEVFSRGRQRVRAALLGHALAEFGQRALRAAESDIER